MNFLRPRKLQPCDHIRIVSPSGPVPGDSIDEAIALLESWGLKATRHPDALARERYFAGPDEVRLAALQGAIDDEGVDAILCSRGGYGAMRLLDRLNLDGLRRDPRLLIGFSDITALHIAAQSAGLATLHGHVARSLLTQSDVEAFRDTLFGRRGEVELDVVGVRGGVAQGPVVGGNLSIVAAMSAAGRLPPLKGSLLFLEDVTEADYRLDRLVTSLRLNPAFADVAGVILGGFDECAGTYVAEHEMPDFVAGLGRELGEAWGVPVVMDFPAGHADRNVPLPFGVPATIDADRGTVTLSDEFAR